MTYQEILTIARALPVDKQRQLVDDLRASFASAITKTTLNYMVDRAGVPYIIDVLGQRCPLPYLQNAASKPIDDKGFETTIPRTEITYDWSRRYESRLHTGIPQSLINFTYDTGPKNFTADQLAGQALGDQPDVDAVITVRKLD